MHTHAIRLLTSSLTEIDTAITSPLSSDYHRDRYLRGGNVNGLVSNFKNHCEGCGFARWFLIGRFTRLKQL